MPVAEDDTARKLREATARWTLDAIVPVADTATSRVFRARSAGRRVALKILKPYGADEINGAHVMAWYGGSGSAEILGIEDHTILMEWLDGGPLADIIRKDNARDDEATAILCAVASALLQDRPGSIPTLMPLELKMQPLLASDLGFIPEQHRPAARRAQAMCADLLATTSVRRPLHGDFHHDNVVGSARGWLAIDPKGLVGDPHYEVANVFRNPYGAGELAIRPARIAALADAFAARLGLERKRLLQWAAAHATISAIWDRNAGNPFDFNLVVLPRLLAAADVS